MFLDVHHATIITRSQAGNKTLVAPASIKKTDTGTA
jgi:hypothetical protein